MSVFNIKKPHKSILIAAAAGILGLACLGFYNTAAAMEKQSRSAGNEVAAATVTADADNVPVSIAGCPGDCMVCGLCLNQQVAQSEGLASSEIMGVETH